MRPQTGTGTLIFVQLVFLLTVDARSALAQADVRLLPSDLGGIERRESQAERRDRNPAFPGRRKAAVTDTPEKYLRLTPSLDLTDANTRGNFGAQFVYDTSEVDWNGAGTFTVRAGYRTIRPRAADTDHFNGANVGMDVQLNANNATTNADDSLRRSDRLGVFSASADYVNVSNRFTLKAIGGEWDFNLYREQQGDNGTSAAVAATLVGTLSYLVYTPVNGSRATAVVPGFEFDYITPTKVPVRVIAEYTFSNNVDGEDDYAFSFRIKLAESSSVRMGTGKHGRVFASFVQVLTR